MDSELMVVTADVFRGVDTVVAITDTGGLVITFAGAEVDSFVVGANAEFDQIAVRCCLNSSLDNS